MFSRFLAPVLTHLAPRYTVPIDTRTPMLLLAVVHACPGLHMVHGAHYIPHPAKARSGGEDAFFFDDQFGVFGIADGVGGSARDGVDPGLFSREVLQRCHQSVYHLSKGEVPTLTDVLQVASSCPISLGGSTTLLLGQLEAGTHTLRLLNLGDSGAMLLRPSIYHFDDDCKVMLPRCVLRTHDQSHGFVSCTLHKHRSRADHAIACKIAFPHIRYDAHDPISPCQNWPFQTRASDFSSVTQTLDELSAAVREVSPVVGSNRT